MLHPTRLRTVLAVEQKPCIGMGWVMAQAGLAVLTVLKEALAAH